MSIIKSVRQVCLDEQGLDSDSNKPYNKEDHIISSTLIWSIMTESVIWSRVLSLASRAWEGMVEPLLSYLERVGLSRVEAGYIKFT